jgi:hypothetical protein
MARTYQPDGINGYDMIQDTCWAIGLDCSNFVFFYAETFQHHGDR